MRLLSTIHKRGILAATEECLLSAMALNLKRMVKAVFSAVFMDEVWAENMISQPILYLCQQIHYDTQNVVDITFDDLQVGDEIILTIRGIYFTTVESVV